MGIKDRRALPYLTKSRHGIYKYRRPIPLALQGCSDFGKEFIRSLGTRDLIEAKKLWAFVNSEFERCIGLGVGDLPLKSLLSPLESIGYKSDSSRHPVARAASASSIAAEKPYTFTDAKWDYAAEKKIDPEDLTRCAARNNWLLVQRVDRSLTAQLGKDKPISDITRRDAIAYRDQLLGEGKAPRTVKKHIELASAVFQAAIVGRELIKANPFRSLPVNDDVLMRDKRSPLQPQEIRLLLDLRYRMNDELADILTLLVYTGARLNEIAGLAIEDVNLATGNLPRFIEIRHNEIRRIKNQNSTRQVPLANEEAIQTAYRALERRGQANDISQPLFPRYGRNGGSDAASAALMKVLRGSSVGIKDRRKGVHSLRHSMKDALRAVGCPADIRDEIQGHGRATVANSYGSGHTINVKSEWLTLACKHLVSG